VLWGENASFYALSINRFGTYDEAVYAWNESCVYTDVYTNFGFRSALISYYVPIFLCTLSLNLKEHAHWVHSTS
jgi:hypothetical protein